MSGVKKFQGLPDLCPMWLSIANMHQNTAKKGGFMGAGTTTKKVTTNVADTRFIQFWFENTATSGDNRGIYLRFDLAGTGIGGEALRAYTRVNDVVAGTAHGAHLSLGFGSTGKLTGLGVAARCTLHIPNQAMSGGGTYAAVQAEIYSDGASSDPAGMTTLACISAVNDGNATGKEDVDTDAVLFDFRGWTAGSGKMVGALGNEPTWASKTRLIKCKLDGVGLTYLVAVDL